MNKEESLTIGGLLLLAALVLIIESALIQGSTSKTWLIPVLYTLGISIWWKGIK